MENHSVLDIVSRIDAIIRKGSWFDFHVLTYDGSTLAIAGGKDLIYGHELEIRFQGVFFVSAFFSEWRSNTNQVAFSLHEDNREHNERFEIEAGYSLFRFKTESYKNDVWIACKSISYSCDTVFYYQREHLESGQRIYIRPGQLP